MNSHRRRYSECGFLGGGRVSGRACGNNGGGATRTHTGAREHAHTHAHVFHKGGGDVSPNRSECGAVAVYNWGFVSWGGASVFACRSIVGGASSPYIGRFNLCFHILLSSSAMILIAAEMSSS